LTAPLRVGLAGLGTVGAGVVKLLDTNAALIERRADRRIEVVAAAGSAASISAVSSGSTTRRR
jgi:homoserine dehydrogenase